MILVAGDTVLWSIAYDYSVTLWVVYWFRHCATNWQVAGSILDGVIGIFQ